MQSLIHCESPVARGISVDNMFLNAVSSASIWRRHPLARRQGATCRTVSRRHGTGLRGLRVSTSRTASIAGYYRREPRGRSPLSPSTPSRHRRVCGRESPWHQRNAQEVAFRESSPASHPCAQCQPILATAALSGGSSRECYHATETGGDRVEREQVLAKLRERIVRFAASHLSRDAAEDLAQEVLLLLHEKYAHLERVEDLLPLSLRIVRFKIMSQRRKSVRHGEYTQVSITDIQLPSAVRAGRVPTS